MTNVHFVVPLLLLLAACGTDGSRRLDSVVVDGPELHASLVTQHVDEVPLHIPRDLLEANPQLSTEREFVEAVARGSSQGRLTGEGIRAALYAVYEGLSVVGLYGLEVASTEEADRREKLLREIWARNASLNRARVHRNGDVLLVVWNAPESPPAWDAVNAALMERLAAR